MIGPRFALLFEAQVNARTVHSDAYDGDTTLSQIGGDARRPVLDHAAAVDQGRPRRRRPAGRRRRYVTTDYGTGGAIMGAIGFELMSARFFAVDLQGRIIEGTYNSGNDHVTSANVGLGFNWY